MKWLGSLVRKFSNRKSKNGKTSAETGAWTDAGMGLSVLS